jgi:RNAse (barnase) inhibitor barstar
MAIDLSTFKFGSQVPVWGKADFVARIPAGLAGRQPLLDSLRAALRLPAYFGNNWDALSDCLRDLSWIEHDRIAVVHEDLPALKPNDLRTYLEILSDSVHSWKPGAAHELLVAFPNFARGGIENATMDSAARILP